MIKVYGASDDLVEVEVDGKNIEEFNAYNGSSFITFDCGVVLKCEYGPDKGDYGGNWKITAATNPSKIPVRIEHVTGQDGDDDEKQDIVYIDAPFKWAKLSKAKNPSLQSMTEDLGAVDWFNVTPNTVRDCYKVVLENGGFKS